MLGLALISLPGKSTKGTRRRATWNIDQERVPFSMFDHDSFTWIPGDREMKHWWIVVADLFASHRTLRAPKPRGVRRVELSCHPLEERVTPSHSGVVHHLAAAVNVHQQVAHHSRGTTSTVPVTLPGGFLGNTPPPSTGAWGHGGRGSHSTNSALQTALQNLRTEVQTIELASATTVGELTAIRVAFQTLASDGLAPSSYSASSRSRIAL